MDLFSTLMVRRELTKATYGLQLFLQQLYTRQFVQPWIITLAWLL
jgi:hypothetical protein